MCLHPLLFCSSAPWQLQYSKMRSLKSACPLVSVILHWKQCHLGLMSSASWTSWTHHLMYSEVWHRDQSIFLPHLVVREFYFPLSLWRHQIPCCLYVLTVCWLPPFPFFAVPILDFRVDIWKSDTSSLVPLDLYTPLTLPGKIEPNMNARIHFLCTPQHGDSCQLPEETA